MLVSEAQTNADDSGEEPTRKPSNIAVVSKTFFVSRCQFGIVSQLVVSLFCNDKNRKWMPMLHLLQRLYSQTKIILWATH